MPERVLRTHAQDRVDQSIGRPRANRDDAMPHREHLLEGANEQPGQGVEDPLQVDLRGAQLHLGGKCQTGWPALGLGQPPRLRYPRAPGASTAQGGRRFESQLLGSVQSHRRPSGGRPLISRTNCIGEISPARVGNGCRDWSLGRPETAASNWSEIGRAARATASTISRSRGTRRNSSKSAPSVNWSCVVALSVKSKSGTGSTY